MYHGERLFALVVLLALTAGWVPASAAVTLGGWDQNQLPATRPSRFEAQHVSGRVLLVPFQVPPRSR